MILSLIAAVSENDVIGHKGDLPWRLPDDLKFFRAMTADKPIVMGRKTFASLPSGALPNRRNIVITRDRNFSAEGADRAGSLAEALAMAKKGDPEEVCIIGGGEIFRQSMEAADRLYITRVHAEISGDTLFPKIDSSQWEEGSRQEHPADAKHAYPFTFLQYDRRRPSPSGRG